MRSDDRCAEAWANVPWQRVCVPLFPAGAGAMKARAQQWRDQPTAVRNNAKTCVAVPITRPEEGCSQPGGTGQC